MSNQGLIVKIATEASEVEAALRLRFEVFNLEMHEGLQSSYATGLDQDKFDSLCDHVLVVDVTKSLVVGTYRLLKGTVAETNLGYYSETEFELSAIRKLSGEKLEIGRACVHKDYRGFAVLRLIWQGIAQYVSTRDIQYLFGVTSVHTTEPAIVNGIYGYLKTHGLTDERCRVTPLKPVPGFDRDAPADEAVYAEYAPPLLSAYLANGAQIVGEPAWDEEFGVSDFPTLCHREGVLRRHRGRYALEHIVST